MINNLRAQNIDKLNDESKKLYHLWVDRIETVVRCEMTMHQTRVNELRNIANQKLGEIDNWDYEWDDLHEINGWNDYELYSDADHCRSVIKYDLNSSIIDSESMMKSNIQKAIKISHCRHCYRQPTHGYKNIQDNRGIRSVVVDGADLYLCDRHGSDYQYLQVNQDKYDAMQEVHRNHREMHHNRYIDDHAYQLSIDEKHAQRAAERDRLRALPCTSCGAHGSNKLYKNGKSLTIKDAIKNNRNIKDHKLLCKSCAHAVVYPTLFDVYNAQKNIINC